ncbi:hypothetical protein, partial [Thiolapillus sp.]|uniref:hypothetical protein n=1 Tax=Thiolapillus sp. TaxID=2017437 RepID=UPI0025E69A27
MAVVLIFIAAFTGAKPYTQTVQQHTLWRFALNDIGSASTQVVLVGFGMAGKYQYRHSGRLGMRLHVAKAEAPPTQAIPEVFFRIPVPADQEHSHLPATGDILA